MHRGSSLDEVFPGWSSAGDISKDIEDAMRLPGPGLVRPSANASNALRVGSTTRATEQAVAYDPQPLSNALPYDVTLGSSNYMLGADFTKQATMWQRSALPGQLERPVQQLRPSSTGSLAETELNRPTYPPNPPPGVVGPYKPPTAGIPIDKLYAMLVDITKRLDEIQYGEKPKHSQQATDVIMFLMVGLFLIFVIDAFARKG